MGIDFWDWVMDTNTMMFCVGIGNCVVIKVSYEWVPEVRI